MVNSMQEKKKLKNTTAVLSVAKMYRGGDYSTGDAPYSCLYTAAGLV